jgi:hypothetical protein
MEQQVKREIEIQSNLKHVKVFVFLKFIINE